MQNKTPKINYRILLIRNVILTQLKYLVCITINVSLIKFQHLDNLCENFKLKYR